MRPAEVFALAPFEARRWRAEHLRVRLCGRHSPDLIGNPCGLRFPGAAQHEAKRNDALQTRELRKRQFCDDPGSAVHRFTLHRIRETAIASRAGSVLPRLAR
jgi:hypothetical protein